MSMAGDESLTGFVLAGGESRRMRHDKALIKFQGEPLVVHALRILEAASIQARIAGARPDLKRFAEIIPDAEPGRGPLSGICAALAATDTQRALFIPVDMPLLPSSLITLMVSRARVTEAPVTLISISGFLQSFPVLLERATFPFLAAALERSCAGCYAAFQAAASGLGRPMDVLSVEHLVQAGQVTHPAGLPSAFWFLNINTEGELRRAEALSGRALA